MAEQLKNSRKYPSALLGAATVTPGVTTTFPVDSMSWLPATGTFRVQFKGSVADGSGDSIAIVGAVSGLNCNSVTWEEVGTDPTYPAGTELTLEVTAAGLIQYIAEQITAHDGLTTAHAAATNLVHRSGAETIAGIKTLSSVLRSTASGSLASVAYALLSVSNTGMTGSFGSPHLVQAGTAALRWTASSVDPLVPLVMNAPIELVADPRSSAVDITLSAVDKPQQQIAMTASGKTVYLPYGAAGAPFWAIENDGAHAYDVDGDPIDGVTMEYGTPSTLAPGDIALFLCNGNLSNYRRLT